LGTAITYHLYSILDDIANDLDVVLLPVSQGPSDRLILNAWIPLGFYDEDPIRGRKIQAAMH
jgi:hypothetical protein